MELENYDDVLLEDPRILETKKIKKNGIEYTLMKSKDKHFGMRYFLKIITKKNLRIDDVLTFGKRLFFIIIKSEAKNTIKIPVLPYTIKALELNGNFSGNIQGNISQLIIRNSKNIPKLKETNVKDLQIFNSKCISLCLPKKIETAWIYESYIDKFPILPESIESINISNTNLSEIKKIPNTVKRIIFVNNNISKIETPLKDIATKIYLHGNPIKRSQIPKQYKNVVL